MHVPDSLIHAVNYILSFKSYVLLPMIILCLALFFRLPLRQAVKSSLTIGIGFIGIFIIFGYFIARIGPAVKALVQRTGLHFNALDVGWPPLAAVTWTFKLVPLLLILIMTVNILMLIFRQTRTVNIDIWNYWHFIFAGMLVQSVTGNALFAILATLIASVVTIKLADWSADSINSFAGISGVSISTLSAVVYYPIGVIGDRLIDKIPFVRRWNADPESLKRRLGLIGEPMMIGFLMGLFLGIGAGYPLKKLLELAFEIAAVIYILPLMSGILGHGLNGISEGMKNFIKKRFPDVGETFIGLDVAIIVGNTSIIVTALLLMPIALLLAFLLPGIRFIPLGDLANLMCPLALIVVATRGNIIRSVLLGIPVIIAKLYIASTLAPLFTKLTTACHLSFEGYSGAITSFLDGGNIFRFWLLKVFAGDIWALLLIPVFVTVLFGTRYLSKTKPKSTDFSS